ncbi:Spy/CpxP family protein refolding chaperone [Devosia sp. A8/3-2]|nr:Spy/CpxP family protein refolding chaperone [Devosia sp. A8/3-2]
MQKPGHDHNRFQRPGQLPGFQRHMEVRHGGGFLNFERGAEAAEIGLVRLSHRVELTAEQQPLFDAMKTAVLAAADDFATATRAARPTADAARPDIAARLDARIAITSANLAALEAIKPSVTAFFASLTPEQQAALTPSAANTLIGAAPARTARAIPAPAPPSRACPHPPTANKTPFGAASTSCGGAVPCVALATLTNSRTNPGPQRPGFAFIQSSTTNLGHSLDD